MWRWPAPGATSLRPLTQRQGSRDCAAGHPARRAPRAGRGARSPVHNAENFALVGGSIKPCGTLPAPLPRRTLGGLLTPAGCVSHAGLSARAAQQRAPCGRRGARSQGGSDPPPWVSSGRSRGEMVSPRPPQTSCPESTAARLSSLPPRERQPHSPEATAPALRRPGPAAADPHVAPASPLGSWFPCPAYLVSPERVRFHPAGLSLRGVERLAQGHRALRSPTSWEEQDPRGGSPEPPRGPRSAHSDRPLRRLPCPHLRGAGGPQPPGRAGERAQGRSLKLSALHSPHRCHPHGDRGTACPAE